MPNHWSKPDETCCDWWGCELPFHNRVPVAVATELLNKENDKCDINTNFNTVNSILPARPLACGYYSRLLVGVGSEPGTEPGPYFRTKSTISMTL